MIGKILLSRQLSFQLGLFFFFLPLCPRHTPDRLCLSAERNFFVSSDCEAVAVLQANDMLFRRQFDSWWSRVMLSSGSFPTFRAAGTLTWACWVWMPLPGSQVEAISHPLGLQSRRTAAAPMGSPRSQYPCWDGTPAPVCTTIFKSAYLYRLLHSLTPRDTLFQLRTPNANAPQHQKCVMCSTLFKILKRE